MFANLPVTALRTFESAARLRSFKLAAAELAVTPTAVSHRSRRSNSAWASRCSSACRAACALTERGASLFAGVHGALLDIAQTLDALRPAPDAGALTVSTTHSFAALWLVPRLGRFHQAYPQYQLRLDANARPVDLLQDASVDVAIRYSQKRYPALVAACSLPESFGVYGAPALAARLGGARAGREAPALVTVRWRDSRLYDEGWRQWCEAAGLPRWRKPAAIHAYEEEHYALQAAIAGQGLVLASSVMVSDSVRLGRWRRCGPRSVCRARPIPRCARRARTASAGARLPGLAGARIRGLSRARARLSCRALLTRRSPSGPRPQPENADREPIPRNDRVPGGGRGAELRGRARCGCRRPRSRAAWPRWSGGWACCCCCAPRAAFG